MATLTIKGPDGVSVDLGIPDGASTSDIEGAAHHVMRNWGALIGGDKTTRPEVAPDMRAGPLRPTAADVASDLSTQDAVSRAREARGIMTPEESAKTRTALAQQEIQSRNAALPPPSPIGFGVSGAIAPNLIDKGMAAAEAGLYGLTGGSMGQPYDEAVETKRLQREQNWQQNPVQTFSGGAGAALSLPSIQAGNPTTRAGWIGTGAATGAGYGGLHGAGEGEGLGEGFAGFLKGAGLGGVLGGALGRATVGLRPQSAEELAAIADAAKGQVRINQAIASPDFEMQQKAGLLSKMPYVGGKLQEGLNTAVGDVQEGVRRVARDYAAQGPSSIRLGVRVANPQVPSDVDAGLMAIDRVRNLVKNIQPAETEQRFAQMASMIPQQASSNMPATRALSNALAKEDAKAATTINEPAIKAVEEALKRPVGLTYEGLLGLRRAVGALQKEDMITKGGTSEPAFRRLYGALSEDLKGLVDQHGGQAALKQFNDLMTIERGNIMRRQRLESIVGKSADITPEKLVDNVMRWGGNGSGRDVRKLLELRRAIGKDGMSDLASVALQRGLMSARNKGEPSIAMFDKFWKSLTPNGKKALFGQEPGLVDELEALSRTTDNIQKVLGETNNSRTSYGNQLMKIIDMTAHSINKIGVAVGGGLIGGGTLGAAVGDLATTGGAVAASAGLPIAIGRLMAYELNKPATVRATNGVLAAIARYVNGPDTAQGIVGLRLALERLSDLAAERSGQDKAKLRAETLAAAKLPDIRNAVRAP